MKVSFIILKRDAIKNVFIKSLCDAYELFKARNTSKKIKY